MQFVIICLFLGLGVFSSDTSSIADTVAGNANLSSLFSVLNSTEYASLLKTLNGTGNFTLFAPNNEAFKGANLNMSKVDEVKQTLLYHVLGYALPSLVMNIVNFPPTLSADPKYVNLGGEGQVLFIVKTVQNIHIYFSNITATVVQADIDCSNGVVHIIDEVIRLPPNTSDVIMWSGLGKMMESIEKTNLTDTLVNTAGLTIFSPTNDAFKKAGIDPQKTDVDQLTNILKNHVVQGPIYTSLIKENKTVTSWQGSNLTFTSHTGHYMINDAVLSVPNVLTENGVSHFIDKVLLPPKDNVQRDGSTIADMIAGNADLSSLFSVLNSSDYEAVLKQLNGTENLTLFAPNNAAFKAANLNTSEVEEVTPILLYHVVGKAVASKDLKSVDFLETLSKDPKYVNLGGKGQVLFIVKTVKHIHIYFSNVTVTVVTADISCSNGIIHIVDHVVMLPPNTSDVIMWSGLSKMEEALKRTKLTDKVVNLPSLTVFAPTNDAFKKAGIDPDKMDVDKLSNILRYHVVSTRPIYTSDITQNETVTSLQGANLTFTFNSHHYMINHAVILVPNVLTENGVVHFIDMVLLPPPRLIPL